MYILTIIAIYFGIILTISYFTSRHSSDNNSFFLGNRKSPWYIVAIGMLGDSISGVTFVSVPGMVGGFDMSYMQLVFGFFVGYIVIAYILLPLYYRLNLISIYTYLEKRFGIYSYKTGAAFFILSRIVGSASKLYLIALILESLVFKQLGVPFYITVSVIILLIWLYTCRSGMKTIIWTDVLQTICTVVALILIIWQVSAKLNFNLVDIIDTVKNSKHSQIFVLDDWHSKQYFIKQFISGIFIVFVMTGLDQNMMQKNLTCRNLKDAQKNMLCYGFGFIPLNFLFLVLGILLLTFASQFNILLPEKSDEILPFLVSEYLGTLTLICFTIGIVAASFSNADSALTSLTTSFCVDLVGTEKKPVEKAKKIRDLTHIGMCFIFIICILLIDYIGQSNILNTIFVAVSYTYGPLLGMFLFGLLSNRKVRDKFVPYICIIAPILSYLIEWSLFEAFNYKVGYEILIVNGGLTALGLSLFSIKKRC